ncbi:MULTISPECIES: pilus assembly protein PilP [unclassified Duganella]|uniref:pilus assembly protein PilP n=1 Tax=unclassified Duganella TaxID=2636909 RepID=UPI000E34A332|nr:MULTISPECIES: pilus assembly protein PilP [unclassified Duganella]RFP10157.1 pilus assembly protein PilP [Duganella sp. BJB475]RFP25537.1 pilus assembly protein PilP [Duganella sp. BJB476]
MRTLIPAMLLAPVLALLAGCGDSDVQEVRAWMKQVDSQAKVAVPPLAEPKTFIPFAYAQAEAIDPFNPNKLLAELAKASAKGSNGIKPDTERRKELLESFPLDTVKMVGTVQQKGVLYGLLQVDRNLHHVIVGQHVGQNFGLITAISDTSVSVKEIVQDAGGDWVERMSKLELQESKENTK